MIPDDFAAGLEPSSAPQIPDILLADDDPDLVNGLARILTARGYSVCQATCGRQAVELARTHRPRVAVMDIRMPNLDGIEAFRQIKQHCPHVAVIFMTGFSEFEQEAYDIGAVAVLRKPIALEHLLATLERLKET